MSSLFYLAVTPKSPIRVGEAKPGFTFLTTMDIIPGSVVRGSLAEYLIRTGRRDEIKSFVENTRFGFLYPSISPRMLPLPLPETALTCKNNSGFKSEVDGHGIFDSLLITVAYTELRRLGALFPVPLTFTCEVCKRRMDRVSRTRYYVKERNYKRVRTERFSHTKVAINRRMRTSEKEMLYTITAIKPKNVFVGRFQGSQEKLETILTALNEVGLGAHTTKGYGRVKAESIDLKGVESVRERVEAFNKRLREVWSQLLTIAINGDKLPEAPKEEYFSVDALSPLILKSEGIPTLKLNLETFGLEPVLFHASPVFIGGWSTAWGLPKPTTYGAGIGSTYVFKTDEVTSEVYEFLEKMEVEGVGERIDEGYGEVLICHPFHREVVQT
ncbi:MAG: type III-D CRISPR-associated RAMP protein Csx10 [Candidatus Freyarchaeota archaeon]